MISIKSPREHDCNHLRTIFTLGLIDEKWRKGKENNIYKTHTIQVRSGLHKQIYNAMTWQM